MNRSKKIKKKVKPLQSGKEPTPTPRERRLRHELTALILLAVDFFLILSLISYNAGDPQNITSLSSIAQVLNWGGKAGAVAAAYLMRSLGLAAFWLPIMLSWLALQFYQGYPGFRFSWHMLAYLGLPLASAGLFSLGWPQLPWGHSYVWGGGTWGRALITLIIPWLNKAGTILFLIAGLLICFMAVTRISYVALLGLLGQGITTLARAFWGRSRRLEETPLINAAPVSKADKPSFIPPPLNEVAQPIIESTPSSTTAENPSEPHAVPPAENTPRRGKRSKALLISNFSLPPLDYLSPPPPWDHHMQEDALMAQARKLETTLLHFGVEGKVVAICPGPVITMIEFEPALGVKISKVTGLADDLALALKALSIRIVAPIPGKAVIGIEVPNPKRQLVTLREIISHEIFHKSASRLTMALGKDITGQPVVTDLSKMPHLLIAGATGTGKSVGLNAMIVSILYKATPEQVRFLMVDPKRIELTTYEGIPHLLHPVVTNPKVATTALRWAVNEMERRYQLLFDLEVRNLDTYNQKIIKNQKLYSAEEEEPGRRLLPFIVIIIDELADLMMVSSRETEEYLIRLAQKSRAAGIHLILATQRPSVDVITGLIKANFPTRVSFQVSSKVDSRTILDTSGAERLLGMGDMLFLPPGTSKLKRIHGAFVSEDEVKKVVDYLKVQQPPEFEPGIVEMQEEETSAEEQGEKDEKYQEAIEIVAETRQASISMLQRRLRVGYNRAARMVEMMEKEGLIGPSDGIKAREVYVPRR